MLNIVHEVEAAAIRIRPYLRRTYLEPSPVYSARTGANVWFKCENLQHTRSFKARGAVNKVMWLDDAARARGVTTASTGNHGAAVAFALGQLDARGIVFVPTTAHPAKVRMIEALGADVRAVGNDCVEAETVARQYADEHGMTYISPYNDPQIVGGQGTIGAELAAQLDRIDAVFVSLGGGGLISGIAGYLKQALPGVQVIGCSPENSRVMIESVRAGAILDLPSLPTLSDGTAGGVEAGAITFDLCRQLVDSYVTVTEDEIAASLRDFIGAHHMLIEGSAAVAIAAFVRRAEEFARKNVVIVLCGANISLETLCKVL
jgi:threonine dehydratase